MAWVMELEITIACMLVSTVITILAVVGLLELVDRYVR